MTYKEYKEKREKLLDEAEVALNDSKMDEYNAKMDEVKKMDDEWEKIRDAAEEMANYNAINGGPCSLRNLMSTDNMMNFSGYDGAGQGNTDKPFANFFVKKGEKIYDRVVKNRSQRQQALERDGALGDVVRGMVTGKWNDEQLRNIVTTTATGTLIPEVLSSKVIDIARDVSLFTRAGVPVVPMETNNITISRIKNDPKFGFKKEGAEGNSVDFELDGVTLKAKTCYGYAYVSLEAIKSSVNLDGILYTVFAGAIAQAIDNGMLYGQYSSETASYEDFAPSGIMNDAGINTIKATAGAGYDDFIKAIGKIKGENGTPNIIGINSSTEEMLSLLKTQEGQYLAPPKAYDEAEKIVSNQLLHDDTDGDDALIFDPNAMVIGLQNNIQIKIIEDGECLKKGLVGFQIYSMVDCIAVKPKHICRITGIKNN